MADTRLGGAVEPPITKGVEIVEEVRHADGRLASALGPHHGVGQCRCGVFVPAGSRDRGRAQGGELIPADVDCGVPLRLLFRGVEATAFQESNILMRSNARRVQ